jgi:two-component system sensor kinase FixL
MGGMVPRVRRVENARGSLTPQGNCVITGPELERYCGMPSRDLQAVMEAAVDAIILMDHRGFVSAFNRSAERLFGYTGAEMIGQNVRVLMPEPYRTEHDAYLERYAATRIPHIIGVGREVEAQRKDGTVFPAFLSVGQVAGSEPPRFIGMIRDITTERAALAALQAERDRAQAHQKSERDARQFQERMTQVARMATMGEMAAGIAHELNQPLSAIATYARACERFLAAPVPDLEETLSSVREIALEAMRAGDIIKRLRQIVSSSPSAHTAIDLNALVKDLSVLMLADARVHRTQLDFDLAPGLRPVRGDAAQLQQLILSFVRNAIEALESTPSGARRIVIRSAAHEGSHIELSVCDNGPGVPADLVDRLFAPFVTTKAQGTGLGLAISETIARAHGGTIGYRPLPDSGACFFVRLPIIEDPA